ncbi:MAG TPA: glycosyltransferase family 4 protein [Thermoleophilaceae bacterium]|jgi:glycosyltransferase involved in cell wall biosynthesis
MRLAYVCSRYPSISHVFILREVLALRRAGVEIDPFTIRRDGEHELLTEVDREEDRRTHVIVPAPPLALVAAHARALLRSPSRYLATFGLALRLRGPGARSLLWQVFYFGEAGLMWRECQRRGIRHIHAHHANVGSDVALLASSLGGPGWSWSFTMHGSTEFFDVREHRLPQKVEHASFVVCVSRHGRSQLMAFVGPEHWDKLHVVHCGVDVDWFAAVDRGGRDGSPEILTVGRTVPVKGQALLVESLAELHRRGLAARLTIVGDGPQLPGLRSLAERRGVAEHVDFVGPVGQDRLRAFYERADVFALPSFAEGLPIVLMEAMATGLPVVASRITGIPELVEEGVSGVLVVPGDGADLTGALERLLREPAERRAEMGAAGRAKVLAEFDVERTARELLAVYEERIG